MKLFGYFRSPVPRKACHGSLTKGKVFNNRSLKVLQEVDTPIQIGTDVVLDVMGLHMNRKLFEFLIDFFLLTSSLFTKALALGENADNFIPERSIDTEGYRWPHEACM